MCVCVFILKIKLSILKIFKMFPSLRYKYLSIALNFGITKQNISAAAT